MTKIVIGLVIELLIGAGCRYFDIPAPSPPKLVGARLVMAMTIGYTIADPYLARGEATTANLCGDPTGETLAQTVPKAKRTHGANIRP